MAVDMSGNVMEWVNDWYDEDYYSYSPYSNPQGPTIGTHKVPRGGSWLFSGEGIRTAFRKAKKPHLQMVSDTDFRFAASTGE